MIHTVFHLVVSEEMNTYIPGGGHFEFYAKWPTEIDHNLFAMVFETFTPIPNTMPNLKNLAPSARFDLYLVYSSPAISHQFNETLHIELEYPWERQRAKNG